MALAVALGGCTQPIEAGDFDKDDPASVRATTENAPQPAEQADRPVMPTKADVNDDAGVQAFIRHYIALFNYGRTSDDWQPLRALSSPECEVCASLAGSTPDRRSANHWRTGRIVVLFDRKPAVAAAEVEMSAGLSTADQSEKWTFYFSLARKGDSWITDRITLIDREE